jgi:hypothetical protein
MDFTFCRFGDVVKHPSTKPQELSGNTVSAFENTVSPMSTTQNCLRVGKDSRDDPSVITEGVSRLCTQLAGVRAVPGSQIAPSPAHGCGPYSSVPLRSLE